MGLDINNLADIMSTLMKDIIVTKEMRSLENLKQHLVVKKQIIDSLVLILKNKVLNDHSCKFTKELMNDLKQISAKFYDLYENFDDKLMIFIVGNGNVGKSTLLNSLIGYEVAKTDSLPVTWKIDVYSPEIKNNEATIKYIDGNKKTFSLEKVEEIIKNEEEETKKAKKIFNQKKKEELKKIKIPEARKEMIKYLEETYLYESNISEVRWPVKKNSLLEKCLLVDTPGLNQDLYIKNKLANVNDYYHKADGVLYLLDANSIDGSSSKSQIDELNKNFNEIGGTRENIVCVINRIDLVRNNDEENLNNAENQVINNALKIFKDKFSEIVPLSAKEAIEGEKNNDSDAIKNSGILKLKEAIQKIFLSKSEHIKRNAKNNGYERLLKLTDNNLNDYFDKINVYESIYIEKNAKLNKFKREYKKELINELNEFFNNYLLGVKHRVNAHINSLANGKKEDFIKNTMYKLDDFIESKNNLINSKYSEIKSKYYLWSKFSKISKYKYIQDEKLVDNKDFVHKINLNLDSLNTIEYFTPSKRDDVFSVLGNLLGKGMFYLRKKKIIETINNTIEKECNEIKVTILNNLNNSLNEVHEECNSVLNNSFSDILFDFNNLNSVKKEINYFKLKIQEEIETVNLKDIIL